jgi:hypothetical protein
MIGYLMLGMLGKNEGAWNCVLYVCSMYFK